MENLCDLRWSHQPRTFLILISEFFLFYTPRGRAGPPIRGPFGFRILNLLGERFRVNLR